MDQSDELEKVDKIEPPQECSIPIEDQIQNQNKFEKEVDELSERAEKLVLLNQEGKFEESIKVYKKALDIIKKNPWGIKEFQVYDLIQEVFQKRSDFYAKKRQHEEIRKIQKHELEKEKELIHAQELINKKRESEKEKLLRIMKENKKREEDYSSQALNLLEKGSDLMKVNKYDEAIGTFNEAKRLLLEINWPITKVEESLQDLEEKRRKYLAKLEKQSVVPQQENIDYAYDLLGKGSKSLKQKDFDIAIKFYEEALVIFRKIGGNTEINRVTESIQEIKNQQKNFIAELKRAKKTREDLEKYENIKEEQQARKMEEEKLESERARRSRIGGSTKKIEEISNTAYDLLGNGSKLLKQKNYDGAIQSYEKAMTLFSEIGNSDIEIKRINESLIQIRNEKKKFFAKLEANKKEEDRLKKDSNRKQEILRKKAEAEKKKKAEIAEKLTKKSEKEKSIIHQTDLAYDLIGKGTESLRNNDFDSALELYNQAKLIFEETDSITELKSVKESILNIQGQRKKYLERIRREEQERKRLELDKKEEEELVRKTKEEKEKKSSKKAEKLRKELERKKLTKEKIKSAYKFIEEGSDFVKKNDFDPALELYNKAKQLFKETGSLTELNSVKESILNIQGQKNKLLERIRREEQKRKKLELDKEKRKNWFVKQRKRKREKHLKKLKNCAGSRKGKNLQKKRQNRRIN